MTTNTETTVHAAKAPLNSPWLQARQLVELHMELNGGDLAAAIAEVRSSEAEKVGDDSRLWAVNDYDVPMTGNRYHALVVAEIEKAALAVHPHRQTDCPGRPFCTKVHTLAELSAPAPAPLAARIAPGSVLALDDLRHRAMVIGQAPHDPSAVRDLARVLEDVIGELIRRKAAEDGTA